MGDYFLPSTAFAQGSFGKVHGGWTLQGQPVAIKILKQPKEAEVKGHQELMELIGYHVRRRDTLNSQATANFLFASPT